MAQISQLPLPARIAIEYLGCQVKGMQSIELLDIYLDQYYKKSQMICTISDRKLSHTIIKDRHKLSGSKLIGYIGY